MERQWYSSKLQTQIPSKVSSAHPKLAVHTHSQYMMILCTHLECLVCSAWLTGHGSQRPPSCSKHLIQPHSPCCRTHHIHLRACLALGLQPLLCNRCLFYRWLSALGKEGGGREGGAADVELASSSFPLHHCAMPEDNVQDTQTGGIGPPRVTLSIYLHFVTNLLCPSEPVE